MTLHPGFRFPAEEEDIYNPVVSFTGIRKYMTFVHHLPDGRMIHEVVEDNSYDIEQAENARLNMEKGMAYVKGREEATRDIFIRKQNLKDEILDYLRDNMAFPNQESEQHVDDMLTEVLKKFEN